MVKTLTKHGNSYALVIDRGIMDLLDIDAKTPLDIKTDGKVLIVSPTREKRKRRIKALLEDTNKRYGRALRTLAK